VHRFTPYVISKRRAGTGRFFLIELVNGHGEMSFAEALEGMLRDELFVLAHVRREEWSYVFDLWQAQGADVSLRKDSAGVNGEFGKYVLYEFPAACEVTPKLISGGGESVDRATLRAIYVDGSHGGWIFV